MNYETVSCEPSDGIGVIRLNRPQNINALNRPMTTELFQTFSRMQQAKVKSVIFTGTEKFYDWNRHQGNRRYPITDGRNMDIKSAITYRVRCFEILFTRADKKERIRTFIAKKPQLIDR